VLRLRHKFTADEPSILLAGAEQNRCAGVSEGISGEAETEVLTVGNAPPNAARWYLSGYDERCLIPSCCDECACHIDAVQQAVAGVLHVKSRATDAELIGDNRGRGRLYQVLAGGAEYEQIYVSGIEVGPL
jgi:hypothetical protein